MLYHTIFNFYIYLKSIILFSTSIALLYSLYLDIYNILIILLLNIIASISVTDALSTVLRLLREESEEASWLIRARSRMEPVEPYDEE